MMSSSANRWVTSLAGYSFRTSFNSIGIAAVSTSLVVIATLRSQSFSRCSCTDVP